MGKLESLREYFKKGNTYTRTEIHARFGGNPRSGFSVSATFPVIFVFTSKQGEVYGYKDGFMPDGFLHIAGEGQEGDMAMIRGNRAVRDHAADGRLLLYFKEVSPGNREFVGEFKYYDYLEREFPDVSGNIRKGILFRLKSVDDEKFDKTLDEIESKGYKEGAPQRLVQTGRERNPKLRDAAIARYGTKCCVCGFDFDEVYGREMARSYIEVHHEKMLASFVGEVDTTLEDVKVVCSNCHRIIHRAKEPLSIAEVKKAIESSRK